MLERETPLLFCTYEYGDVTSNREAVSFFGLTEFNLFHVENVDYEYRASAAGSPPLSTDRDQVFSSLIGTMIPATVFMTIPLVHVVETP